MAKKDQKSKHKKLRDFENWPQQANLTQAMLEEKKVWNLVNKIRPEATTPTQTRKKDKNNTIKSKIIK